MFSIGKNIGILFRQFNIYLNHELKDSEITATEFMYMGSLYQRDGITQDELAREYLIDNAATTRTLQKMEEKGLIIRQIDSEDKRGRKVFLTEKALAYKDMAIDIQTKFIQATRAEMTQEELEHLEEVVCAMVEMVKNINREKL